MTTNGNGKKPATKPAGARPFWFFDNQWWLITTAGMNAKQKAAFIDMLAVAWQSEPPATLADDDDELASIARVSVDEWRAMRRPIMAQMTKALGKRLVVTKLREQYDRMCHEHDENVRKGRAGAAKRWQR